MNLVSNSLYCVPWQFWIQLFQELPCHVACTFSIVACIVGVIIVLFLVLTLTKQPLTLSHFHMTIFYEINECILWSPLLFACWGKKKMHPYGYSAMLSHNPKMLSIFLTANFTNCEQKCMSPLVFIAGVILLISVETHILGRMSFFRMREGKIEAY